MKTPSDTLVLAWGNPGRRDDGLGPEFAARFADCAPPGVSIETDYQLQVEDAAEVARHRRVIFVDADRQGSEPFRFERLHPTASGLSFSSHSVTPGALLALSRDLFQAEPEAWVLGIRGHEFDDFGEGLSEPARLNLAAAVEFMLSVVGVRRRPSDKARGSLDNRPNRESHARQEDVPCRLKNH